MKLGVVKAEVVDASLKALKLDDKGDLKDKIARLVSHFRTKTAKADIADCDTCGGESDVNFAIKGVVQCPYCGDQEVESDKPAPKVEPPKEQKLTLVRGGKKAEVVDATTLDASMRKVNLLKVDAVKNLHALATEIRRIHDTDLWKLRKVEGLIAYKNFKAFCVRELMMSHTYAYKLIEVAKAFTAEQVEALGVSKLGILVNLPADHRKKLLAAAGKGASTRSLKGQADKLAGKPPADAVTVAVAFGRVTIPLFARPPTTKADPKPAKKIEDDPWAVEEMVNDLRTLYWVKRNTKGELALVIERRRP